MVRAILFVGLFLSLTGYSEEWAGNRNLAVVSWVLFNDRYDFLEEPKVHRKIFNIKNEDGTWNQKTSFQVPEDQYFTVPVGAPLREGTSSGESSFAFYVRSALEKLESQQDPQLIVVIDSHGGVGELCQQNKSSMSHELFLAELFFHLDQFQKKTKKEPILWLFYDACFSDSLTAELIKQITDKENGKYQNGSGERYNRKVRVFTSSDAMKVSWASQFSLALEDVSLKRVDFWSALTKQKPKPTAPQISWLDFCLRDWSNDQNYWSSFDEAFFWEVLNLLHSHGEKRQEGLRALRKFPPSAIKGALPEIARALSSVREKTVVEAVKVLALLGEEAAPVSSKLQRLTFHSNEEVRLEAAHALVHISPALPLAPRLRSLYLNSKLDSEKLYLLEALLHLKNLTHQDWEFIAEEMPRLYIIETGKEENGSVLGENSLVDFRRMVVLQKLSERKDRAYLRAFFGQILKMGSTVPLQTKLDWIERLKFEATGDLILQLLDQLLTAPLTGSAMREWEMGFWEALQKKPTPEKLRAHYVRRLNVFGAFENESAFLKEVLELCTQDGDDRNVVVLSIFDEDEASALRVKYYVNFLNLNVPEVEKLVSERFRSEKVQDQELALRAVLAVPQLIPSSEKTAEILPVLIRILKTNPTPHPKVQGLVGEIQERINFAGLLLETSEKQELVKLFEKLVNEAETARDKFVLLSIYYGFDNKSCLKLVATPTEITADIDARALFKIKFLEK